MDPITLEPKILHYAALASALPALAPAGGRNSIHVTAGDHTLPGPFYRAAAEVPSLGAPGMADIAFFNAMGLTANGTGNHEFDGGIDDFARMLAAARYPFISANLDFSKVQLKPGTPPIRAGQDGGSVTENAGRVVRSAYVEVGGQKIGLIGRAPADFFNIILRPNETTPGLDFIGGRNPANNQPLVPALGQVLEQVALLEARGVNKILLVDHAQDFTADPLSTKDMHGIDVIITAGSTGFIARAEATGPFNRLRPGDKALGEYPVRRADRDGHPILVVNSDQLYRYIGNLIVGFDAAGHVVSVDPRSGPVATTQQAVDDVARLTGRPAAAPADVQRLFEELRRTPLISRLLRVVGETATRLNGERADVRTRETNLGSLVADSVLWLGRAKVPGDRSRARQRRRDPRLHPRAADDRVHGGDRARVRQPAHDLGDHGGRAPGGDGERREPRPRLGRALPPAGGRVPRVRSEPAGPLGPPHADHALARQDAPRPARRRGHGHRRRELRPRGGPGSPLHARHQRVPHGGRRRVRRPQGRLRGARRQEGGGARAEQQTLIDYVDKVLARRVDRPDPVREPRIVRVGG